VYLCDITVFRVYIDSMGIHWTYMDIYNLGGSDSRDSSTVKEFHITCYVVAGCYFIPAFAAFFQLIRFIRVPYLPRFVLQKAYALLLIIAVLLRVVFFLLSGLLPGGYSYFYEDQSLSLLDSATFSVMSDLGEMFFFFAFSLLGLFWAEIHYNTSKKLDVFERRIKPIFFSVLGTFIIVELCCWILLFVLPDKYNDGVNLGHDVGYLVVYGLCTVFTLVFSHRVFHRVYYTPLSSSARSKKLTELVLVTAGCMLFLVFHAVTTILYAIGDDMHDIGFVWLTVIGFVCEVIPSLLLLFVLRTIPQQGPSQPINTQHVYSYSSIRNGSLPATLYNDIEKKS